MTTTTAPRPALLRPSRMALSGVSAGVAEHLGWPVLRVRLSFVVLTVLGGAGVLLYLWLWALVPIQPEDGPSRPRRAIPVAAVLVALAAAAALTAMGFSAAPSRLPLLPGIVECIALGVGAVVWTLALDRADPSRTGRYVGAVRVMSAVVLGGGGAVLLIADPTPLTAVLAVLMLALGVAALFIPLMVTLWSDLITERSARARQAQHAEIAAHLHDSVLQTLAIIQNRAGPQSEIARIARAQERELRDWLFAGTDPFAGDLATELRTFAAALELEYPVRIEVVTVGEVEGGGAGPLLSAVREAMVNAARHAGGDVSVYLEASPDRVQVFVRDRGPGFDLAAVPPGRLGIRESIVGRMTRAGGAAEVSTSADGTEVHLLLPAGVRA